MTPDQTHQVLDGIKEIKERLSTGAERFDALDSKIDDQNEVIAGQGKRFDRVERQRNGLLFLFTLAMVITAFSVGYAWNSGNALDDQIETNRNVVCSQARSTASAFREPLPGESKSHFLRRMYAQRETLLAVDGLDCSDVPGFFNFERQRRIALVQLDRILIDYLNNGQRADLGSFDPTERPDLGKQDVILADSPSSSDPSGPARPESPSRPDRPGQPDPDRPNNPPNPDGDGDGQEPTPTPPNPVDPTPPTPPAPVDPTPPTPSSDPGLLDPALDIVCRVNVAGIRVCTK